MESISEKNLLDFVRSYFEAIGMGAEAGNILTAKKFSMGLVIKLPPVCLVPANKPYESNSNQTHIHITGSNRYFFFDKNTVDTTSTSSEDEKQKVQVSPQNIQALKGETVTNTPPLFQESFTMKKIACRASQKSQVQISKLGMDGRMFLALRNCLYESDLLIFLKCRTGDEMYAIGIPRSFYEGKYTFKVNAYVGLESNETITVKNALTTVMNRYSDSDIIDSDEEIYDAIYQEIVSSAPDVPDIDDRADYRPVAYVPSSEDGEAARTSRPPTDPSLGKAAIRLGGHCCAVDKSHDTFIKKNGDKYIEVHHLIPLEQQSGSIYKLDTLANLVPVCPLCHKLLHYGRLEDKIPILTKLYDERKESLKKSGLDITLEALIKYYE